MLDNLNLAKISGISLNSVGRSEGSEGEFFVEDEGPIYEPSALETERREFSETSYHPLECEQGRDYSEQPSCSLLRKSASFASSANKINFETDSRVDKVLLISQIENSGKKTRRSGNSPFCIANYDQVLITGSSLKTELVHNFSVLARKKVYTTCHTMQVTKKITIPRSKNSIKQMNKFIGIKKPVFSTKKPKFVAAKKKSSTTKAAKNSLRLNTFEGLEKKDTVLPLKEVRQTETSKERAKRSQNIMIPIASSKTPQIAINKILKKKLFTGKLLPPKHIGGISLASNTTHSSKNSRRDSLSSKGRRRL